ncbi:GntR family transcriptional regulator (plasmid) [Mycoplasmopsis gallopavonis]|uniref:GntR family transcriptional regulator n=2 Tax=Mycoplasmopsis gallopavonis TaxID=76629 RepID=A0A449B0P1_9BACT|nr:GntR family transcriptional regulator [Mycoplasmopsis gallopavonis]VEU73304.1 GntR family transcriptional regulator [Mycoplasmopsis gallopavonis]
MDLIQSGRIPVNKIMPSEHQLMHKFDCSRNVVVSAYQKLESLGAAYSISKRGHFVAENFHNLIKPVSFLFESDRQVGDEVLDPVTLPEWTTKKRIIFIDGFRTFRKKYYKNQELIAESEIYLSLKNVDLYEPVDISKPIVDILLAKNELTNVVYEVTLVEKEMFGYNLVPVIRFFGYDIDSISIAGMFYIHPKHFKFYHQEFSLTS